MKPERNAVPGSFGVITPIWVAAILFAGCLAVTGNAVPAAAAEPETLLTGDPAECTVLLVQKKVKQDTTKAKKDSTGKGQQLQQEEDDDRYIYIGKDTVEVRGFHTLKQIRQMTGVPEAYLIKNLKLPANTSVTRNVGYLRRQHGFTMQDLRKHIREYLKKK